MNLPEWLEDPQYPRYLRDAAREAGEEVLATAFVPADVLETVAGLRTALLLWSWLYENGVPAVPDDTYDAGFRYLQRAEGKFPELRTKLSPTQRVGRIMP